DVRRRRKIASVTSAVDPRTLQKGYTAGPGDRKLRASVLFATLVEAAFINIPHSLSLQARRSNGRWDGDGRRKHGLHVHLYAVHLAGIDPRKRKAAPGCCRLSLRSCRHSLFCPVARSARRASHPACSMVLSLRVDQNHLGILERLHLQYRLV